MTSLYDAVGGEPVFQQLVADFYAGVAQDPVLRPLYPDDLGPAAVPDQVPGVGHLVHDSISQRAHYLTELHRFLDSYAPA